jgi:hypothetical protein
MEKNMKHLLLLCTLLSGFAFAGPYVTVINDFDLDKLDPSAIPSSFDDTQTDLRVGYSGKYGYIEYGQYGSGFDFDTGDSAEAGYKVNFGGFELKGKVEGYNVDEWDWGVETELRYNFW